MGYPLLVAAGLVERDGRVLLALRRDNVPYGGCWEFPGGKVEPDEDPRQTVVRELREELGIAVTVAGVYDVIYHRYPERTVLVMVFRCTWVAGEIEHLEVADHRWVYTTELTGYRLLPADIPVAERLALEAGVTQGR